jgi:membrane-bound inhibitor of C-type lysozyme
MRMHGSNRPLRRRCWVTLTTLGAIGALVACAGSPSREEQEAARNTLVCKVAGERLVVRFDSGEARLLTAEGERITLYQLPSASGVRYSNGMIDLRGKGADMQMVRNGTATALTDCQPYTAPK